MSKVRRTTNVYCLRRHVCFWDIGARASLALTCPGTFKREATIKSLRMMECGMATQVTISESDSRPCTASKFRCWLQESRPLQTSSICPAATAASYATSNMLFLEHSLPHATSTCLRRSFAPEHLAPRPCRETNPLKKSR
jgi:hypothetical protein